MHVSKATQVTMKGNRSLDGQGTVSSAGFESSALRHVPAGLLQEEAIERAAVCADSHIFHGVRKAKSVRPSQSHPGRFGLPVISSQKLGNQVSDKCGCGYPSIT